MEGGERRKKNEGRQEERPKGKRGKYESQEAKEKRKEEERRRMRGER